MALPTQSRHWVLANKPEGLPIISGPNATFSLVTRPLRALNDGEVVLRTRYLSNDPAQRLWISSTVQPSRLYVPPVNTDDTMRSYSCICEVLDSKAEGIPVGGTVICDVGWRELAIVNAEDCMLIKDLPGLEPVHWISLLGTAGVTALYGLDDIAHTKASDSIVISGAAGGVGSVAVQIAKHVIGCRRVIGIAGSEAKCRWVESLGADICLNYKDKGFENQLIDVTQEFVEVFYDNVGGLILDMMLSRMALHGRVVACGAISEYNSTVDQIPGIKNWYQVIAMRLQIRGMVVLDAIPGGRWEKIVNELVGAYQQGKIKATKQGLSILPTRFEDVPKTWLTLFDGSSSGKLLTQLV
ncbi:quinone oxidoreductase [Rhinocladiella similis]